MTDLPVFLRETRAQRPTAVSAPPAQKATRAPGEPGIWVFILGDMTMFAVFFGAFLVQRGEDPELFARGRETLSVGLGALNTVVLLTSSLLVATAVRAHRAGRVVPAQRLVAGAGLCALVFASVKVTEWLLALGDGHAPGDDAFHMYYFLLTGVHFLHLLIGAAVLAYWWSRLRSGRAQRRLVECCASYWHMVDLLWVVIFPVLYLSAT